MVENPTSQTRPASLWNGDRQDTVQFSLCLWRKGLGVCSDTDGTVGGPGRENCPHCSANQGPRVSRISGETHNSRIEPGMCSPDHDELSTTPKRSVTLGTMIGNGLGRLPESDPRSTSEIALGDWFSGPSGKDWSCTFRAATNASDMKGQNSRDWAPDLGSQPVHLPSRRVVRILKVVH